MDTNKKRKLSELSTAEDADTGGSGSTLAQRGANSGGSSLSPTETTDGLSSSSTVPMGDSYEVFLSFRGPDTRNNFADHLYHGLRDVGIHTFRDKEELRQGEEIRPDLLAAIKNSQILIPILSVNYGESKWCLEELVQIMECKKNKTGHIVLPVFYKVAPADVRYQKGSFGEAFNKRENSERQRGSDSTILEKWKEALREVSDLKGWEANGPEAELVKSVVQRVLLELKKKFELVTPENLVGIDSHVETVVKFVDSNSHAPLFVGIHGMGGIGKTTLAKTIYNKLSSQFDHRSFIADVRESCKEKGVLHLQNQLIFNILNQLYQVHTIDEGIRFLSSKLGGKKVLILLDDVDDDKQLKALAGNHNWFSSGSVIIITTRDESILDKKRNESILNKENVYYKYEHKVLDEDNSLILFSRHAFRRDRPPSEFKELTDEVLHDTGGLPLSLEVLGSFLCGKKETRWKETVKKLRKGPHEKVQQSLRISYEALTREQKQIFLDIACFFIGSDKTIVSYMWDACDYFPEEGIEVLIFLSLIKVGDDHELRMHDQLRDLGRALVRAENEMEPGKRSRLWDPKEAIKMLEGNEGTRKVEAIRLGKYSSRFPPSARETTNQDGCVFTGEQFKELRNLRFLEARGAHFSGDFNNSIRKLKWLQWEECPSTFEASNFCTKELAVLNLADSKISDEWQGWSFITMAKELKFLNLTDCKSLENTSFLSAFEKLEVLILEGCENIEQIDSSIGKMKSLVRLNLFNCNKLKELPVEVGKLKALEQLILQSCGITQLPDSIRDLQNLEALNIFYAEIEELPNDIGRLTKLRELNVKHCEMLREMPESIRNLSSLQQLDLGGCDNLESLPVLPSSLKYLQVTCGSRRLEALSNQTHLKELQLPGSEFLECIGEPPSIPSEESLNTPSSLEILVISDCDLLEIPDVSQFNHLRKLSVTYCSDIREIRGLDKLKYLESLRIDSCCSIERLELPKSHRLKKLDVKSCNRLVEIRDLDWLAALEEIVISSCSSIERLDVTNFVDLKEFRAGHCDKLVEIQGLNRKAALEKISIYSCDSIERLDLTNSDDLKEFYAQYCNKLVEIQGLNRKAALEKINIYLCPSIERLDLTNSDNLKEFYAGLCYKLVEIQGLNRKAALEKIRISGSIERLDLTNSDDLKEFYTENCDNQVEIQGLNRKAALEKINICLCPSIERRDLTNSDDLKEFYAKYCNKLIEIQGLNRKAALEKIRISGCRSVETLDLTNSEDLKELGVGSCENLSEIQGLDRLEYLKLLDMSGCTSFGRFPDLCCFDTLHTLAINYGDSLHNIQSLGRFPSCKRLWIEDYKSLAKFLNLSNFCNLQTLVLSRFHELREILGLEKSTSLKNMAILGCSSIEILPDLSSCTNMVCLVVHDCEKLTELRGLEKLERRIKLDISGCKSLKTIPELPRAKIYQNYELRRWKSYDDAMTVLVRFDEVEDEDDYEEEDDEDEDVDDDEDEYEDEDEE